MDELLVRYNITSDYFFPSFSESVIYSWKTFRQAAKQYKAEQCCKRKNIIKLRKNRVWFFKHENKMFFYILYIF